MVSVWPIAYSAYKRGPKIGDSNGAASGVWAAECDGRGPVALKIFDLDLLPSLEDVRREVQAMGQLSHENLAQLHAAFVVDHTLWFVMQQHACGSCADIMNSTLPGGFEETPALVVLREVGRGLAYLHEHGTLHRNLKSSSILIDAEGDVRLADFGFSVSLYRGGELHSKAATFVGSHGWMAPEVLEQASGYDAAADIWSFGITAIELTRGAAPYAGMAPLKVMLRVLHSDPPVPAEAAVPAARAHRPPHGLAVVDARRADRPRRRSEWHMVASDHSPTAAAARAMQGRVHAARGSGGRAVCIASHRIASHDRGRASSLRDA